MASTSLESKIPLLKDRAQMFSQARAFFGQRNVIEVDCPALSFAAPIDRYIDVMQVTLENKKTAYLHTSPEYGMKRLLAAGMGDIYQISHVFRDGEVGPLHNPEFTMVEWYRLGFSFDRMIEETLDFTRLFLGQLPSTSMTYKETLKHFLKIDECSAFILLQCAQEHGLNLPEEAADWEEDTLLQALLITLVEPNFGKEDLFVLKYFPPSQAALSKTILLDTEVACRFEIYYKGIEIANGYHELTDPIEQKQRLLKANSDRLKAGKSALKIDTHFLNALEKGLPDCCGVAVGFDRLMQLKHKLPSIKNALCFSWEEV